MVLKVRKPNQVTSQVIGTTTILRYPVYSNGSYGQPEIISSYNFVPNAQKKKKQQKPRKILSVSEEDEGVM